MEDDEPRTDYTLDELLAADHDKLAAYAAALQNALKIARKLAEKKIKNSPLRSVSDL